MSENSMPLSAVASLTAHLPPSHMNTGRQLHFEEHLEKDIGASEKTGKKTEERGPIQVPIFLCFSTEPCDFDYWFEASDTTPNKEFLSKCIQTLRVTHNSFWHWHSKWEDIEPCAIDRNPSTLVLRVMVLPSFFKQSEVASRVPRAAIDVLQNHLRYSEFFDGDLMCIRHLPDWYIRTPKKLVTLREADAALRASWQW